MRNCRTTGVLLAALLISGWGCASTGAPPPTAERPMSKVEQDERRSQAHYKLGIEELRTGNPALAIRELRTSLKYGGDDPWAHLALAEAYRQKGFPKMAEDQLNAALDTRPDFQQARLNLSALCVQLGRYDEAIEHADRLLRDPTFPVPWKALTNRGYALLRKGDTEAARESLELAVEYHPNYWQAVLNLGILEDTEGHRLDALERFETVLVLQPGGIVASEVNYRMGEIYVALGDRTRALQHLAAAASEQRSGPWGKRSQEYLEKLR
jgi:Tfp pilus assembly protein PilF